MSRQYLDLFYQFSTGYGESPEPRHSPDMPCYAPTSETGSAQRG